MKLPLDHRRVLLGLLHLATIAVSLTLAYHLRFDFWVPAGQMPLFYQALGIALPVKMVVFVLTRLHRHWWWRFVDLVDLFRLLVANALASLAFAAVSLLVIGRGLPWSIYCIDFLICFLLTAGARFSVRLYREALANGRQRNGGKGILIYGAGDAGTMLVREIRANPRLGYKVIGFLDDDPRKHSTSIMGVPVLGGGADAARMVAKRRNSLRIEEIIIAIPSATGRQMRRILADSRAAGIPCKTMPGLGELLEEKILIPQIRNVSVNDLLGREPIQLNEDRIRSEIVGRTVLVTGAAGSIGSELCRQVAGYDPRTLVALDQAESELFKIEMELREKYPSVHLVAEIGDIRDTDRVEQVIRRHAPDSILHAAAYKHVPMMECHLREAVKNNILGTWNVAQAAARNRVSGFLLISTDKAVNPTSIMGVTKRVAELVVSAMQQNHKSTGTKFVSVRFGNVLGSSGSVVPIFQAQIAAGGPVTVTHPEARRYFMTVREAVQLVLQAYTMGKGTEIFVLDMGEPIRIVDLARNMIRLSGFVPDEDIEIQYTGLRPGEKIYEELTTQGENILPTYHDKIKIFARSSVSVEVIDTWIGELATLLERSEESALVVHLKRLVSEYQPAAAGTNTQTTERTLVARGKA
jgi:FlaA1/EpsC-like NDP-sugar epimerase